MLEEQSSSACQKALFSEHSKPSYHTSKGFALAVQKELRSFLYPDSLLGSLGSSQKLNEGIFFPKNSVKLGV